MKLIVRLADEKSALKSNMFINISSEEVRTRKHQTFYHIFPNVNAYTMMEYILHESYNVQGWDMVYQSTMFL